VSLALSISKLLYSFIIIIYVFPNKFDPILKRIWVFQFIKLCEKDIDD